jgi:lipopolysaccharide transport system ATP-binding protein
MQVIQARNISKRYTLSQQSERYLALRDVIARNTKSIISSVRNFKSPATNRYKEDFWALHDVSFDVRLGDRVGVIGRNGAGKSTLLKVLSRITEPTSGKIAIRGRVASLLEVGTGFHPELSGRENIYLNGAILGMPKADIKRRFDEIVAFADVEKFLDTPVKRYSSGMYVRLAFAVAAHLEPDILIIDEVLAVGDAEFQKKCLGKMSEVATEGRTVIFVSHNMGAIKNLCNTGIVLSAGKTVYAGPIKESVDHYLQNTIANQSEFVVPKPTDADIPAYVEKIFVEDEFGNPAISIPIGRPWQIRVKIRVVQPVAKFVTGIGFMTIDNLPFRTVWASPQDTSPGQYEAVFREDTIVMGSGRYNIIVGLSAREVAIQSVYNVAFIEFEEYADKELAIRTQGVGLILNKMETQLQRLS